MDSASAFFDADDVFATLIMMCVTACRNDVMFAKGKHHLEIGKDDLHPPPTHHFGGKNTSKKVFSHHFQSPY